MMTGIFGTMLLALAFAWRGRTPIALACLLICLGLSIGLFLYEIYSPDYGFRMPWLQVELGNPLYDGASIASVGT